MINNTLLADLNKRNSLYRYIERLMCLNRYINLSIYLKSKNRLILKIRDSSLAVLAQLANAEIARPDVMIRVRTRDLTVMCEFNFI
jgi:hypothetical protein